MNDRELFEGIKQRNISCFEQIMNRYTSYIAKIVTLIGNNNLSKEDIEEITADVFISIWKNADRIDIIGDSMKSYLAAIARNKAKTVLTSRKIDILPLYEDILSTESLVYDDITQKETSTLLINIVREMGDPDREIFIRRYFFFEKVKEIAEHLSMNQKTVETRLIRGREKLRSILAERGFIDGKY